jgi:hypothetical protein
MGVIEDLKREAERRKQELSEEEAWKVRRDTVYKNGIRPAMQAVFRYLNEMTEHLNFLKPEVGIRYTLPGYGEIGNLVQEDYRMAVDSTEQPKFIKLWFTRRSPDDLVFTVTPRSTALDSRRLLQDLRMEFSEWPLRDAFNNVIGLGFEARFTIPVVFLFRADMENEAITMTVANFEGFNTLRDSFRPTEVNDELLEDLGNYILGRSANLRALHISDQERQQIRQRLRRSDAARKQELEAALQREYVEREDEESRLLKNRLRQLVQQGRSSVGGE